MKHSPKTDPNLSPPQPPRGRARPVPTEEPPEVSVARARRRQRVRARLFSVLVLILGALASLFLLALIYVAHAEYSGIKAQVEGQEAKLAALDAQYEVGQRRLQALESGKGVERLLIEHGYIRPGDRILLFPPTPEEQAAAAWPKNDLTSRPAAPVGDKPRAAPSSAWQSGANVLRGWWKSLRGAVGKPAATPSAEQPAAVKPETSADAEASSESDGLSVENATDAQPNDAQTENPNAAPAASAPELSVPDD